MPYGGVHYLWFAFVCPRTPPLAAPGPSRLAPPASPVAALFPLHLHPPAPHFCLAHSSLQLSGRMLTFLSLRQNDISKFNGLENVRSLHTLILDKNKIRTFDPRALSFIEGCARPRWGPGTCRTEGEKRAARPRSIRALWGGQKWGRRRGGGGGRSSSPTAPASGVRTVGHFGFQTPPPPPGLLLTTRHHLGGGGDGKGVPDHTPSPLGPTIHPSTPVPLKHWAKFSSRPLADQKFSLAPLAPISLDQKFSSVRLQLSTTCGGGGVLDPPPPLKGALPPPPPPPLQCVSTGCGQPTCTTPTQTTACPRQYPLADLPPASVPECVFGGGGQLAGHIHVDGDAASALWSRTHALPPLRGPERRAVERFGVSHRMPANEAVHGWGGRWRRDPPPQTPNRCSSGACFAPPTQGGGGSNHNTARWVLWGGGVTDVSVGIPCVLPFVVSGQSCFGPHVHSKIQWGMQTSKATTTYNNCDRPPRAAHSRFPAYTPPEACLCKSVRVRQTRSATRQSPRPTPPLMAIPSLTPVVSVRRPAADGETETVGQHSGFGGSS